MSFTTDLKNHLIKNLKSDIWPSEEEWPTKIEDYNLLILIGHGTFGRVFRSYCKQNGKECAIKCISKKNSPNINKILSEVYIHIRLSHPNVLQLFTVLEDAKAVYLVMEICRGGSLSQLLREETERKKSENIPIDYSLNPILSYSVISSIIIQICSALEYLHRNSIVHRDINSNNILLANKFVAKDPNCSLQIKLADFGLAIDQNQDSCLNDSLFGTTICGTPGYISPEVWNKKQKVSYKSDIFSLGSIVFACIAGYTPKGDVDLNKFYPMTANLIARLLDHDPEKRPDLSEIRQHIFLSGRINSFRLFPIEKQTKTLKMSIDKGKNVMMSFIKENVIIKVVPNGSQVAIFKNKLSSEYDFYALPEKYWKHYLYVTKFVNLVKSKTCKITIHCWDWFQTKESNKEYINKCVLMDNGDFEVTSYNRILDENSIFLLKNDQDSIYKRREFKFLELYLKVLHIEKELEKIGKFLDKNLFPITLGIDHKLVDHQKQSNLIENNSFLKSEIIRSFPINGIGHATQFSNNSIKVNFNDGSDLCMDSNNQIFYLQDNVLKKFNKDQILPPVVVDKIAKLPQEIERLINN